MSLTRPSLLKDIVGQKEIIKRLQIIIRANKQRNETLSHILFDGPPGLGKTTFSTAIANELGADIQIANGANLRSIKAVLPYLMRIKENDVFFIDEIHRCPTIVQEFLYPVMEDFRCDLGKETNMVMSIPAFTFIGATTNAGLLAKPLQDRFPHKFHLAIYSTAELCRLVALNSIKMRIVLTKEACEAIANASRGTPRISNNILTWVNDYAMAHSHKTITHSVVVDALAMAGISSEGMDENDRKYLQVLKKAIEPLGLKSISSMTDIDVDTIANNIEPFLLRHNKIRKTPRGRIAV